MSKSKALPATTTLGNAQQQVASTAARSRHVALKAKVTLASTLTITPRKAA